MSASDRFRTIAFFEREDIAPDLADLVRRDLEGCCWPVGDLHHGIVESPVELDPLEHEHGRCHRIVATFHTLRQGEHEEFKGKNVPAQFAFENPDVLVVLVPHHSFFSFRPIFALKRVTPPEEQAA